MYALACDLFILFALCLLLRNVWIVPRSISSNIRNGRIHGRRHSSAEGRLNWPRIREAAICQRDRGCDARWGTISAGGHRVGWCLWRVETFTAAAETFASAPIPLALLRGWPYVCFASTANKGRCRTAPQPSVAADSLSRALMNSDLCCWFYVSWLNQYSAVYMSPFIIKPQMWTGWFDRMMLKLWGQ